MAESPYLVALALVEQEGRRILPLEVMSEQLPILKASWMCSGDTAAFHEQLATPVNQAWRISIAR